MKRTVVLLLTLSLSLMGSLAGGSASATQAPQARHGITDWYLPPVDKVGWIYDYIKHGGRETYPVQVLLTRSSDCMSADEASPKPTSGRGATYLMPDDEAPYLNGHTDISVIIVKFHNNKHAHKMMKKLKWHMRDCLGTYSDDTVETTSKWVKLPKLGHERVGQSQKIFGIDEDPSQSDSFAEYWVRKGKVLVGVIAQDDDHTVDRGSLIKLCKLGLKKV